VPAAAIVSAAAQCASTSGTDRPREGSWSGRNRLERRHAGQAAERHARPAAGAPRSTTSRSRPPAQGSTRPLAKTHSGAGFSGAPEVPV